jgi:hypothetical protein
VLGGVNRQIEPMVDQSEPDAESDGPAIPVWGIVGGGSLLLITAIAAPFYNQVMGGLLWAGETLKALCGW